MPRSQPLHSPQQQPGTAEEGPGPSASRGPGPQGPPAQVGLCLAHAPPNHTGSKARSGCISAPPRAAAWHRALTWHPSQEEVPSVHGRGTAHTPRAHPMHMHTVHSRSCCKMNFLLWVMITTGQKTALEQTVAVSGPPVHMGHRAWASPPAEMPAGGSFLHTHRSTRYTVWKQLKHLCLRVWSRSRKVLQVPGCATMLRRDCCKKSRTGPENRANGKCPPTGFLEDLPLVRLN